MAAIIQIKRSGDLLEPSILKVGELAYSYRDSSRKLFIGIGPADSNDDASAISIIGGEYYTDLLTIATPGVSEPDKFLLLGNLRDVDYLRIRDLYADDAEIERLVAGDVEVFAMNADKINVSYLNADSADVNLLRVLKSYTDEAYIDSATIEHAFIDSADIVLSRTQTAYIDSATIEHAFVDSADIILSRTQTAYIDSATIEHAFVDSADIILSRTKTAYIDSANIEHAFIDSADIVLSRTKTAYIDSANIEHAFIDSADIVLSRTQTAYIDSANIEHAYIDSADIVLSRTQTAYIDSANIEHAFIDSADIVLSRTQTAYIDSANIEHAYINHADIEYSFVDSADINEARIDNLRASTAGIDSADIDTADIKILRALNADIDSSTLVYTTIKQAEIDQGHAKVFGIDSASIEYANIIYGNVINLNADSFYAIDATIDSAYIKTLSVNELKVNDIFTGMIKGPEVIVIDPTNIGDNTGKLIIKGDLQIDGVTTTVNSTTVTINDKNIVLADSAADASQADGAGITIAGADATITYRFTDDRFVVNKDLQVPSAYINYSITDSADIDVARIDGGTIDSAEIRYAKIQETDITLSRTQTAYIDSANVGHAYIDSADVALSRTKTAYIDSANIEHVYIDSADINVARINKISTDSAGIQYADIDSADVDVLRVKKLYIEYASIDSADIRVLRVDDLSADSANIEHVYIDSADIVLSRTQTAYIDSADIKRANIEQAYIDNANVGYALIDSADIVLSRTQTAYIDSANVGHAYIDSADIVLSRTQTAYIDSANIEHAFIDSADIVLSRTQTAYIDSADVGHAYIDSADIVLSRTQTSYIDSANVGHAFIDSADIVLSRTQTAYIDSANIEHALIDSADIVLSRTQTAYIDSANVGHAFIDSADIVLSRTQTAYIDSANIGHAFIDSADIVLSRTQTAYIDSADVGHAYIDSADIVLSRTQTAYIDSADVGHAFIDSADIVLSRTQTAYIDSADVGHAYIDSADINYAKIQDATIDSAEIRYAKIDSSDIESLRSQRIYTPLIYGPGQIVIDPIYGTDSGDVVIRGNLIVQGYTTTVNSTEVTINDKNLVLADSALDSNEAHGAGITINGANAKITYSATTDKFIFNKGITSPIGEFNNLNVDTAQIDYLTVDSAYIRVLSSDSAYLKSILAYNIHVEGELTGNVGVTGNIPNAVLISNDSGKLISDSDILFNSNQFQLYVDKVVADNQGNVTIAGDLNVGGTVISQQGIQLNGELEVNTLLLRDTNIGEGYIYYEGLNDSVTGSEDLVFKNFTSNKYGSFNGLNVGRVFVNDSGYYNFSVDVDTGLVKSTGLRIGDERRPSGVTNLTYPDPTNLDFYGLELTNGQLRSTVQYNEFKSDISRATAVNTPFVGDSATIVRVVSFDDSSLIEFRKDGTINFSGELLQNGVPFTGGGVFTKTADGDAFYKVDPAVIAPSPANPLGIGGRVGINTTDPKYNLEARGDFMIGGNYNPGAIQFNLVSNPITGTTHVDDSDISRLSFFSSIAALRGGYYKGSVWTDLNNYGSYSTGFGRNVIAAGYGSFAVGENSKALGQFNIAMGDSNTTGNSFNDGTIAIGRYNEMDSSLAANDAIAIGLSNKVAGDYAIAIGANQDIKGNKGITIGSGNSITSPSGLLTTSQRSSIFGHNNTVSGAGAYVIGEGNTVERSNTSVTLGVNNSLRDAQNAYILGVDNRVWADNGGAIGSKITLDSSAEFSLGIGLSGGVKDTIVDPRLLSIQGGNVSIGAESDYFSNYDGNLFVAGTIMYAGDLVRLDPGTGNPVNTNVFVDDGTYVTYSLGRNIAINKGSAYQSVDLYGSIIVEGNIGVQPTQGWFDSTSTFASVFSYIPEGGILRAGADFDPRYPAGYHSIALGRGNVASGISSITIGSYNLAFGNDNIFIGKNNIEDSAATGDNNYIFGQRNSIDSTQSGTDNYILGTNNTLLNNTSKNILIGHNIVADNISNQVIIRTQSAGDSSLDATKVAIGKNSAQYALDINGSIRLDSPGTIYFGSKTIQQYLGFGVPTSGSTAPAAVGNPGSIEFINLSGSGNLVKTVDSHYMTDSSGVIFSGILPFDLDSVNGILFYTQPVDDFQFTLHLESNYGPIVTSNPGGIILNDGFQLGDSGTYQKVIPPRPFIIPPDLTVSGDLTVVGGGTNFTVDSLGVGLFGISLDSYVTDLILGGPGGGSGSVLQDIISYFDSAYVQARATLNEFWQTSVDGTSLYYRPSASPKPVLIGLTPAEVTSTDLNTYQLSVKANSTTGGINVKSAAGFPIDPSAGKSPISLDGKAWPTKEYLATIVDNNFVTQRVVFDSSTLRSFIDEAYITSIIDSAYILERANDSSEWQRAGDTLFFGTYPNVRNVRVGIGTDVPDLDVKFQVAGNVRFDSDLNVKGKLLVSGTAVTLDSTYVFELNGDSYPFTEIERVDLIGNQIGVSLTVNADSAIPFIFANPINSRYVFAYKVDSLGDSSELIAGTDYYLGNIYTVEVFETALDSSDLEVVVVNKEPTLGRFVLQDSDLLGNILDYNTTYTNFALVDSTGSFKRNLTGSDISIINNNTVYVYDSSYISLKDRVVIYDRSLKQTSSAEFDGPVVFNDGARSVDTFIFQNGLVTTGGISQFNTDVYIDSTATLYYGPGGLSFDQNIERIVDSNYIGNRLQNIWSYNTDSFGNQQIYYDAGGAVVIGRPEDMIPGDSDTKFLVSRGNAIFNHGDWDSAGPVTLDVVPDFGAGARMMWIPQRGAFRAGAVDGISATWNDGEIGTASVGIGINAKALEYSVAIGYNASAGDLGGRNKAVAIGYQVFNPSADAVAIGYDITHTASRKRTVSIGKNINNFTRDDTVAIGTNLTASGGVSIGRDNTSGSNGDPAAIGINAVASGSGSAAIGKSVTANSSSALAIGINSTAGNSSVAVGKNSEARGSSSTAVGNNVKANSSSAVSVGSSNEAGSGGISVGRGVRTGNAGVVLGASSYAYAGTVAGINSYGYGSTVLGSNNRGWNSTVIGSNNTADRSVAIGTGNTANYYSFSIGIGNRSDRSAFNFGLYNVGNTYSSINIGGNNNNNSYSSVNIGYDNSNNTGRRYGRPLTVGISNTGNDGTIIFGRGNTNNNRTYIWGNNNASSSDGYGYIYGSANRITRGGYVYGLNHVVTDGGFAVGSGNIHNNGGYSFGSLNTHTFGGYSFGYNNTVDGSSGTASAFGYGNTASGSGVAVGYNNTVSTSGLAFGRDNTSSGIGSVALGTGATVSGTNSVAIGLSGTITTPVTENNTLAIMGGRVAIGTNAGGANPSTGSILDVNGAIDVVGTNGEYYRRGERLFDYIRNTVVNKSYIIDNADSAWIKSVADFDYLRETLIPQFFFSHDKLTNDLYYIGGGNVGIKTNNPLYDLHVNGDINFDGRLLLNGDVVIPSIDSIGDVYISHITNEYYIGPDSAEEYFDSNYVQARQAYFDYNNIINEAYINLRIDRSLFLDSQEAIGLINTALEDVAFRLDVLGRSTYNPTLSEAPFGPRLGIGAPADFAHVMRIAGAVTIGDNQGNTGSLEVWNGNINIENGNLFIDGAPITSVWKDETYVTYNPAGGAKFIGVGKSTPLYEFDVSGAINADQVLINGQDLLNDILDSDYIQTRQKLIDSDSIIAFVDSDYVRERADSDYVLSAANQGWIRLNADSDYIKSAANQTWIRLNADSDYIRSSANRAWIRYNADSDYVKSAADSDYIKSAANQGWIRLNADSDYIKSAANQTWIRLNADSDYVKSAADSDYVKSAANQTWIRLNADSDYVKSSIDSSYISLLSGIGSRDINFGKHKISYSNAYSSLVALPNPSTYEGMFAVVKTDNRPYAAFEGSWNRIAIGQNVRTTDNVLFNRVETTNGLIVNGDLQVNGVTSTVNSVTLEVTDNMIYMNAAESEGSPVQFVDVGFAANVNDKGSYEHTGFFRDATDGVWKLFQGYEPEPDAAPQINTGHASFSLADLQVSRLIADEIVRVSNVGIGSYGSSSLIPVISIDSYGFIDSIGEVSVAGVDSVSYNTSSGQFTIFTADGNAFSDTITLDPFTTDDLNEGVNNLYYTNDRVINLVDSAYVLTRSPQFDYLGIIDSAYVQARIVPEGVDSAAVTALIDSAYVLERSPQFDYLGIIDSAYVLERSPQFDYLGIIDSAYVQARIVPQGVDSAAVTALIDSAYINERIGITAEVSLLANQLRYQTYYYSATPGQTVVTGVDQNGATLDYSLGTVQVFLNGINLLNGIDYTATDGHTITLAQPTSGSEDIFISTLKITGEVGFGFREYLFTADSGQTEFFGADDNGVQLQYTLGNIIAHLNGIKLLAGVDYTATDGNKIVLNDPALLEDELTITTAYVENSQVDSNLNEFGDITVNGLTNKTGRYTNLVNGIEADSAGIVIVDTVEHNSRFTSIEYILHMEDSSNGHSQISKMLVTYNKTNVFSTEYGIVNSYLNDSDMGLITADVSGSTIRLKFEKATGTGNVTVKPVKTIIQ